MPDAQCHPGDVLFIQFAKSPQPGRVKTRMQPRLSPDQACTLHIDLLLWSCGALTGAALADVELWVAGSTEHPVFEKCQNLGVSAIKAQQGEDLGERMYHALCHGLQRYRKVILVGSDCPRIDADYLNDAILALDKESLVLGPASDGGYVLIGATHIHAAVFKGIVWGDESVFSQTVQRILELGERYYELGVLSDIDRPEDLPLWESLQEKRG